MDHRPTKCLPGFPACRLFALLDSDAAVEGALVALAPHVEPGAVQVLTAQRVSALGTSRAEHRVSGGERCGPSKTSPSVAAAWQCTRLVCAAEGISC